LRGDQILGLTFTEKAAGEMKSRVAAASGERGKDVQLSTSTPIAGPFWKSSSPVSAADRFSDHWILLARNLGLLRLDAYRRLAEPGQFLGDFREVFSPMPG